MEYKHNVYRCLLCIHMCTSFVNHEIKSLTNSCRKKIVNNELYCFIKFKAKKKIKVYSIQQRFPSILFLIFYIHIWFACQILIQHFFFFIIIIHNCCCCCCLNSFTMVLLVFGVPGWIFFSGILMIWSSWIWHLFKSYSYLSFSFCHFGWYGWLVGWLVCRLDCIYEVLLCKIQVGSHYHHYIMDE